MTDDEPYFPASATPVLLPVSPPVAPMLMLIVRLESGARRAKSSLPAPRLAGIDHDHRDDGGEQALLEKPRLKKPPLYKVILINDDYTPMEFVVEVLEMFFKMNREQATQIMLTVHTQGKGVCGIYTRDIAETKAAQVNQYARDHQHPLLCEIEASEGSEG